jgi:hypothetical protein
METRPVEEHDCTAIAIPGGARVKCSCGAEWVINQKELDAEEFKIDYHKKYAKRTATRPD